jgi:hypothetical protein
MSETLITPENPSSERHAESSHNKAEGHHEAAQVESEEQKSKRLEHLRGQIEHEAADKKEASTFDNKTETSRTANRPPANKELKGIALKKELKHIRSRLGSTDKLGSKIIHNPVVRSISEVSSKTISRPSGLLGGGIVAFLGSGAYYYLTKHIGLRYNYLLFTLLFIAGFIVGLAIELGVYSLGSKKSAK